MAGGRPTLYRDEFCDEAIELGRQGKSRNSIACHFEVVMSTIQNWEAAHPQFLAAMTRAKQLEMLWWENLAQDHMVEGTDGKRLNTGAWSRSMAARFPNDYRDNSKLELAGKLDVGRAPEELEAELAALRKKHGAGD